MAGGLSESDGDFGEDEAEGDEIADEDAEATAAAAVAPAGPRPQIYNTELLHDKLEDISWTESADWLETLVITSDSRPQIENVEDDLTRELAFFNQVCIPFPWLARSRSTLNISVIMVALVPGLYQHAVMQ